MPGVTAKLRMNSITGASHKTTAARAQPRVRRRVHSHQTRVDAAMPPTMAKKIS